MTHTPNLLGNCVEWSGSIDSDGYGRISKNGKWKLAHRVQYEDNVSKIEEGLVIDHLCRNRKCVNVNHMEVVTIKENTLRGIGPAAINSRKSKCHKGHEFDETNEHGNRKCGVCRRERWKEYRLRKIDQGTWIDNRRKAKGE